MLVVIIVGAGRIVIAVGIRRELFLVPIGVIIACIVSDGCPVEWEHGIIEMVFVGAAAIERCIFGRIRFRRFVGFVAAAMSILPRSVSSFAVAGVKLLIIFIGKMVFPQRRFALFVQWQFVMSTLRLAVAHFMIALVTRRTAVVHFVTLNNHFAAAILIAVDAIVRVAGALFECEQRFVWKVFFAYYWCSVRCSG